MRPGDLVRLPSEYIEVDQLGLILKELPALSRFAENKRFDVLFPDGIFIIWENEMEVVGEAG